MTIRSARDTLYLMYDIMLGSSLEPVEQPVEKVVLLDNDQVDVERFRRMDGGEPEALSPVR